MVILYYLVFAWDALLNEFLAGLPGANDRRALPETPHASAVWEIEVLNPESRRSALDARSHHDHLAECNFDTEDVLKITGGS